MNVDEGKKAMERGFCHHLLLSTKLAIPPSYRKKNIRRQRLYAQLHEGVQRPLTLVIAPAGFGKTSLLSEWLRQQHMPGAWVSLDAYDNDPERFWHYVITALVNLSAPGTDPCAIWPAAFQPSDLEELLTSLLNLLADVPGSLILVLDNYHTVTSALIHQSLTFLLEHLPPQIHLVISSRLDPAFPLARLRVQGRLAELRTAELCFTLDETDAFLGQCMDLALDSANILELQRRTEGWIAGLQLAAISLQGRDDPATAGNFVRTFSGTNRTILQYLKDEILAQIPEDVQHFLLLTSVLERLNASLSDAVTEQANGRSMLEWLEQSNLSLIVLDDQEYWYRYYHLFTDLLLYCLQQKYPTLIPLLHLRASSWFEQHNCISDALHHAVAACDYEHVAALLAQHMWWLILQGENSLVASWLHHLPASIVSARPALSYLHAWTLFAEGHLQECEQALLNVERAGCAEERAALQGYVCNFRATIAVQQGHSAQVLAHAQQALTLAAVDDGLLRSHVLINLGVGALLAGEVARARSLLLEAYALGQKYTHQDAVRLASLYISDVYRVQGDLHAAVQILRPLLAENAVQDMWYVPAVHTRLAQIYYEWNDIVSALDHWKQAMQRSEHAVYAHFTAAERYILAARLAWVRGEHECVMTWLEQAEQSAHFCGQNPLLFAQIASLRVQFLLAQGELAGALRWNEFAAFGFENPLSPCAQDAWHQTQARVRIAQDNPQAAIVLLENMLPATREQGRVGSEIATLVLLCLAYQAEGSTQQTMQTLERALALAEPRGSIHAFVDEGASMTVLLAEFSSRYQRRSSAEQQGISRVYLHNLLVAAGQDVQSASWIVPADSEEFLLDKLSEREQTVLGLIAEGLSNQEIAHKLVVTVSTIKTHLNNIYAKLHVHTRLQAVTRAYDLGLLKRSELDAASFASLHA